MANNWPVSSIYINVIQLRFIEKYINMLYQIESMFWDVVILFSTIFKNILIIIIYVMKKYVNNRFLITLYKVSYLCNRIQSIDAVDQRVIL